MCLLWQLRYQKYHLSRSDQNSEINLRCQM